MSKYPMNMVLAAVGAMAAGFAVANDAGEEARLKEQGYKPPGEPAAAALPTAPKQPGPSPMLMYQAGRLGVEVDADMTDDDLQKAIDAAQKTKAAKNDEQARADTEAGRTPVETKAKK